MSNKLTELEFNALVEQCMKSGFFKSKETAERYVLKNCQPEPEPEFGIEEEVFNPKPSYTFDDIDLGGFKPRG